MRYLCGWSIRSSLDPPCSCPSCRCPAGLPSPPLTRVYHFILIYNSKEAQRTLKMTLGRWIFQVVSQVCKKAGDKVEDEVGPLSPSLLNRDLYLAVVIKPAPHRTQGMSYSVTQSFRLHTDGDLFLLPPLLLWYCAQDCLYSSSRSSGKCPSPQHSDCSNLWGGIKHLLPRSTVVQTVLESSDTTFELAPSEIHSVILRR